MGESRTSLAEVIMAQACLSFVLDYCPEVFSTQLNISLYIMNLNLLYKALIISSIRLRAPESRRARNNQRP